MYVLWREMSVMLQISQDPRTGKLQATCQGPVVNRESKGIPGLVAVLSLLETASLESSVKTELKLLSGTGIQGNEGNRERKEQQDRTDKMGKMEKTGLDVQLRLLPMVP
jgi:hypothetical protein